MVRYFLLAIFHLSSPLWNGSDCPMLITLVVITPLYREMDSPATDDVVARMCTGGDEDTVLEDHLCRPIYYIYLNY